MAAIVASNFAVAARQGGRAQDLLPPRRASRYVQVETIASVKPTISSARRERDEGERRRPKREAHSMSRASRATRGRGLTAVPNPRSTTVKRSVSVKAVRKQQVVARCVRQIENPSPCDFRRAIARVDARSERGRAGTRARDHDRLEPLLALAPADSEASDRARAAAAAATQRHASEVSPDRSTVRG